MDTFRVSYWEGITFVNLSLNIRSLKASRMVFWRSSWYLYLPVRTSASVIHAKCSYSLSSVQFSGSLSTYISEVGGVILLAWRYLARIPPRRRAI
ncbi:hypothetical protein BJX61DRAFT_128211 [Aspergillus egyptiacus]|nr:hypothetical protein BJX61DRAFT_128211 [Aspergillus egyptiacus]